MTDPYLFDRDAVMVGLRHLDEVLSGRKLPRQEIVVVGGSYLALADLREATRDIDTVTLLAEEVRNAIKDVAEELGYADTWLNDSAARFRPAGLTESHCTVEYDGVALRALMPSADWVFLMKLYAARAIDYRDLVRLWPHAGFESPSQAVSRFWEAYPHAPADDDLLEFVATIAQRGTHP